MNKPTISCLAVTVGLWAGVPGAASAQSAALQEQLHSASSLTCQFTTLVTGSWEDDVAGASVGPSTLSVAFNNVNVDEGTADADGDFGVSFIVVRADETYLHLIQMFGAGPLYTTSIMAQETTDGRMMAIHTRAEYTQISLPGFTSRPEMYLGDCEVSN